MNATPPEHLDVFHSPRCESEDDEVTISTFLEMVNHKDDDVASAAVLQPVLPDKARIRPPLSSRLRQFNGMQSSRRFRQCPGVYGPSTSKFTDHTFGSGTLPSGHGEEPCEWTHGVMDV